MRGVPVAAETTRFDLFAPNAAIAYDTLAAEYSIAIDFLTLQALNLKYGIGINISLCELQIKNAAPRQWSFFPVQIVFNPVNYDELLWVYLYAGAKLLFHPFDDARYDVNQTAHNRTQTRSSANPQFVAAFGARFSFIPYSAPKTMYRQHSVNVFLEYSTLNAFSVGISLPAASRQKRPVKSKRTNPRGIGTLAVGRHSSFAFLNCYLYFFAALLVNFLPQRLGNADYIAD